MKADIDYLKRHYASLSDDELMEIDRKDLVAEAQVCYDEEVARRGPMSAAAGAGDSTEDVVEDGDEPEWLDEAASVYVFISRPGSTEATKARHAAQVLRASGIPVFLSVRPAEADVQETQPQYEYHVLVPGELSLHAASVLDKEIFNEAVEATWKSYFRGLSDDELLTADTEMLFAGLRDRWKRATKAYKKELGRRGLETPSPKETDGAN